MEASEKLTFTEDATIRVLDGRLVIERLAVEDERAARIVRERAKGGHEPAATVRDAIEIGARVLEREGTAAEVDYVKAEFGRHTGELAERLVKMIESGNDLLAEEIAKSFGADRKDSVQQQIRTMLDSASEAQRESLGRQFSAKDGSNPLFDFKDAVVRVIKESRESQEREAVESRRRIEALTREIVELKERDAADLRVAEAEEAGTRKGRTFEERVDLALERLAAARGDASSHTGGEHAEGGGRKGDTLIELGGADGPPVGRIVFEAKDKKLSKNDAWRELNEAMAARAAAFGVLVVAGEDRVPAGRETLTEYEGNKLIVAVDRDEPQGLTLEVAYRLAAARVAMARDRDLTVDAAAVRDASHEAVSCLKQGQAIRATLTGIKTSSDKARVTLDEMVESVRARLERIDGLVEAAEPAD